MKTENEEMFAAEDTDMPVSNLLEKGRYEVETIDIKQSISRAGNNTNKITLKTNDGFFLTDYFVFEGKMAWKWKQFLFAIGIRNKGQFQIPKSRLIGVKCLADIIIKERSMNDGTLIKENRITAYSPIIEETAPITGVEPEIEPAKETPKKEKEATEEIDDL